MLLDMMADMRVSKVARMEGRSRSDEEKGLIVGQLRRQLSTASLRAAMSCLLDRMHQCGEGGSLAAKRRETNHREEIFMRNDREKYWVARVRGAPVRKIGHFFKS